MAEIVDGLPDLALTWSGQAMDVGRIEAELGKLRYLAAGEPPGGEGFALRTSLLNMVVYSEHDDGAQHAGRVIEDLASHHPSRALLVVARPSESDSHIAAQLAAHCHIAPGLDHRVCCEEVTLKVSGRAAAHLHSVIIPLLVPDLPVYVWWTEQLPERTHLLEQLLEASDRVIVDSDRFEDQEGGLLRLAELLNTEPRATLGDLSWDRVETWRDLIQQQRQIAEMRHHLSSVKSVEIRYADGHAQTKGGQAFLLLAWLAGELGWDAQAVSGHGRERLTLRGDERDIAVYLRPVRYPAVDPGSLVSLKIACESETARALLTMSRTGDPNHLTIRTEHRGGAAEGHLRLDPCETPDMLTKELDAPAHDQEYNTVLRRAVPLVTAARVSG